METIIDLFLKQVRKNPKHPSVMDAYGACTYGQLNLRSALLARKEQSGMIAAVLLAVGIGLPVVYVGTFLSQVNVQAVQRKLKPARSVYTVTLREEGIRVENDQRKEDPLEMEWASVQRAFRKKGCIYLYVSAAKAFLLPDGQADVPDAEVWDYLSAHLGKEKCR